MTKCDELGCPNIRWEHTLQRDVCDQRYPEPEGCPLIEEQKREWARRKGRLE